MKACFHDYVSRGRPVHWCNEVIADLKVAHPCPRGRLQTPVKQGIALAVGSMYLVLFWALAVRAFKQRWCCPGSVQHRTRGHERA